MNIIEVLENKRNDIREGNTVVFSGEEINLLCDVSQLVALKLYDALPSDYTVSENMNACVEAIKNGDSIYRTLEYCIWRNRALDSVKEVFPKFESVRKESL